MANKDKFVTCRGGIRLTIGESVSSDSLMYIHTEPPSGHSVSFHVDNENVICDMINYMLGFLGCEDRYHLEVTAKRTVFED